MEQYGPTLATAHSPSETFCGYLPVSPLFFTLPERQIQTIPDSKFNSIALRSRNRALTHLPLCTQPAILRSKPKRHRQIPQGKESGTTHIFHPIAHVLLVFWFEFKAVDIIDFLIKLAGKKAKPHLNHIPLKSSKLCTRLSNSTSAHGGPFVD